MEQIITTQGARLSLPENPSDGDTIGITVGATTNTYEFDDDSSVTAGNISVTIASTPAETLYNLVTAVNRLGTLNVVAEQVGESLHLRPAATPGGAPLATYPNVGLAESITPASCVWDRANLNIRGIQAGLSYPTYPQFNFPVNGAFSFTLSGKYTAHASAAPNGRWRLKVHLISPSGQDLGQENELTSAAGLYSINFLKERIGQTVLASATSTELIIDSDTIAAGSLDVYVREVGDATHPGELEITCITVS